MKVTNYHSGNYTFADPTDSSVMYGAITMTKSEFGEVIKYLQKEYKKADRRGYTYIRDGLNHMFSYTLPQWAKRKQQNRYPQHNNRICLGVTATELLFEEYNLPRYKKQNYVIIIK